jgi:RNA polymerase sigma-70 factor (ECF subfamily)
VRALERAGASRGDSPDGSIFERVEARDALSRALVTLSEEEREAVALRYGADLTLPEIAKLAGEKLTTVEGRVYRALRKLREELE